MSESFKEFPIKLPGGVPEILTNQTRINYFRNFMKKFIDQCHHCHRELSRPKLSKLRKLRLKSLRL